jgi:hypothetical protein
MFKLEIEARSASQRLKEQNNENGLDNLIKVS